MRNKKPKPIKFGKNRLRLKPKHWLHKKARVKPFESTNGDLLALIRLYVISYHFFLFGRGKTAIHTFSRCSQALCDVAAGESSSAAVAQKLLTAPMPTMNNIASRKLYKQIADEIHQQLDKLEKKNEQ